MPAARTLTPFALAGVLAAGGLWLLAAPGPDAHPDAAVSASSLASASASAAPSASVSVGAGEGAAAAVVVSGSSEMPGDGAGGVEVASEPGMGQELAVSAGAPAQSAQDPAVAGDQAAAVAAGEAAARVFARPAPGVSQEEWFAGLEAYLAVRAVDLYRATDPANVPYSAVTGPGQVQASDAPASLLTVVTVPTDAGTVNVELEADERGWVATYFDLSGVAR